MNTDDIIFQYGKYLKVYADEQNIKMVLNLEGVDKDTNGEVERLLNSILMLMEEKSFASVLYSQNKKRIVVKISKSEYFM